MHNGSVCQPPCDFDTYLKYIENSFRKRQRFLKSAQHIIHILKYMNVKKHNITIKNEKLYCSTFVNHMFSILAFATLCTSPVLPIMTYVMFRVTFQKHTHIDNHDFNSVFFVFCMVIMDVFHTI